MNPVIKNILAVVAGWISGSILNSLLVNLGPLVFSLPEGADTSSMEALNASLHLFESKHFVFPFLGHALGTLLGAFVAYKIAASNKYIMAMIIGILFLIGGVTMWRLVLPAQPEWFTYLDLLVAYLPMAWLGSRLAK